MTNGASECSHAELVVRRTSCDRQGRAGAAPPVLGPLALIIVSLLQRRAFFLSFFLSCCKVGLISLLNVVLAESPRVGAAAAAAEDLT